QPGQWVRTHVLRYDSADLRTGYVRLIAPQVQGAQIADAGQVLAPGSIESCGPANGNWPMLGQGAAHTFNNKDEQRLSPPLTLTWQVPGYWNLSNPAVMDN